MTNKKRKNWTKEEDQYLLNHHGPNMCISIANNINRSVVAVRQRVIALGLSAHYKKWTKEEEQYMVNNCSSKTWADIGIVLERPSAMVGKKAMVKKSLKQKGKIIVKGELWRAELLEKDMTINTGETVVIQGIKGLKLLVVPEISQKTPTNNPII